MQELLDRVAIVTGGASGIGRATALMMAKAGARIVVADRDETAGPAVAREIVAQGGKAVYQSVDVSSDEQCASMVDAAVRAFGTLDIAFNNAAISGSPALLHEVGVASWRRMLDVTLSGVFHCMTHQLKVMKERGRGAIVNTSSVAGLVALPGMSHYSAAKHGVIGLTKAAAGEYARYGIRINALCPGFTTTAMSTQEHLINKMDKIIAKSAMRRAGTPEEQAEMVLWLCSDRASFVTGAHFNVDGGLLL